MLLADIVPCDDFHWAGRSPIPAFAVARGGGAPWRRVLDTDADPFTTCARMMPDEPALWLCGRHRLQRCYGARDETAGRPACASAVAGSADRKGHVPGEVGGEGDGTRRRQALTVRGRHIGSCRGRLAEPLGRDPELARTCPRAPGHVAVNVTLGPGVAGFAFCSSSFPRDVPASHNSTICCRNAPGSWGGGDNHLVRSAKMIVVQPAMLLDAVHVGLVCSSGLLPPRTKVSTKAGQTPVAVDSKWGSLGVACRRLHSTLRGLQTSALSAARCNQRNRHATPIDAASRAAVRSALCGGEVSLRVAETWLFTGDIPRRRPIVERERHTIKGMSLETYLRGRHC